jgi:Ni/Co efflux regulator RcnB
MKLLTTAAMALALTGVAAAAHADDQQKKGHSAAPPAHAAPPAKAPPSHGPVAGQGGQHFNAAAGGAGGQHFNSQAGAQGSQHFNSGAGGAGGQHFNGQAGAGGPGGQGQANGQFQRGNGQHFNGQAGAGGPGGQGQANGQFQRGNGQHFNGQAGGGASLGFQNHAARGRDQGRVGYSANTFEPRYRAQRQFRFGGYRSYPSGWGWRNWSYGQFLPFGWYAPQYYLSWDDYGLPAPPVGCEWIAEGPDAVLVDVWTGQVLSVYSGVFDWNG